MDDPDSESRKRRIITPNNFTARPQVGASLAESTPPSADPGTWDFLAKWAAADDTLVEDLDDGECYSDVSEASPATLEATEHESEGGDGSAPDGPAIRPSKLGADKVIEVINHCIEAYANAWTPGKGETKYKDEIGRTEVPVTYDALALWEEAEAAGKREELAEQYELEAEYYRQRLDKLCEEISKDPGDTIAGVQVASVSTRPVITPTDCARLEMQKS